MKYEWHNGVRRIPHWARREEDNEHDAAMLEFERYGTHDHRMPDRTPQVAQLGASPWWLHRQPAPKQSLRQRLAARYPHMYRLNADGSLTRLSAQSRAAKTQTT